LTFGTHVAFASVLYLGGATLFDYKPDWIGWLLAAASLLSVRGPADSGRAVCRVEAGGGRWRKAGEGRAGSSPRWDPGKANAHGG
jgi:hypothetical protein